MADGDGMAGGRSYACLDGGEDGREAQVAGNMYVLEGTQVIAVCP